MTRIARRLLTAIPGLYRRARPHAEVALLAVTGAAALRLLLAGSVAGALAALVVLAVKVPVGLLLAGLAYLRWGPRAPPDGTMGSARMAETRELAGWDEGPCVGLVPPPPLSVWDFLRAINPAASHKAVLAAVRREWWPVRLPGPHRAIFGRPGGGKSSGVVIGYARDCPDSMVIVDMKEEILMLSAPHRRARGQAVVRLAPFGPPSNSYDPLRRLAPDDPELVDKLKQLSEAIVVREKGEKQPHFNDRAEVVICAVMLAVVLLCPEADRHIQSVRLLLSDAELMARVLAEMAAGDHLDGIAARYSRDLSFLSGEEAQSVYSTVQRHMRWCDSLPVSNVTQSTDWDVGAVLDGNATVYLCLPSQFQRSHRGLLRYWLTGLITEVVQAGLSTRKVQVLIDEAASLGKLECLSDTIQRGRGNGLNLTLVYQNIGQLTECWGEATALLGSVSTAFLGVADYQTAELVSQMTGDATVFARTVSRSRGGGLSTAPGGQETVSSNWGESVTVAPHHRRLRTPREILDMHERECYCFAPGYRPVNTYVRRYYDPPTAVRSRWPGAWRLGLKLGLIGLVAAGAMCAAPPPQPRRTGGTTHGGGDARAGQTVPRPAVERHRGRGGEADRPGQL